MRRDRIAAGAALLLVVLAFVVPHLHLGVVTPLIRATAKQIKDYADTAPIFGWWNAHIGWGMASTARTSWPRAVRVAQIRLPMKPAAPVRRTRTAAA